MTKIRRRRINEWTSTGKSWPLTASLMAIIVSLSFLFWKEYKIEWLYALIGLPLLCFAMTGIIYKFLFPAFKRNIVTNILIHMIWTSVVAVATSFIATKELHCDVLLAVVPVTLIAAGITHGKNSISAYAYAFKIVISYLYVVVFSLLGYFPMSTISIFLTVAIAVGCSKTMINSIEGGAHMTKDMGARTANLLHLFSILLATAFVVGKLLLQK